MTATRYVSRRDEREVEPATLIQETPLAFLYYRPDLLASLRTPEGRQKLAAQRRKDFAFHRDELGWESTSSLRAAAAIEAADWPMIAAMLRKSELARWARKQTEHRNILKLTRQLARIPRGGTP